MAGNKGEAQKKFAKVMREFERGTLKSSSGKKVTSREQAKAIAASEARDVNPNFGRS